eukprot:3613503-Lingulodinium_polyedra.AAC.1
MAAKTHHGCKGGNCCGLGGLELTWLEPMQRSAMDCEWPWNAMKCHGLHWNATECHKMPWGANGGGD